MASSLLVYSFLIIMSCGAIRSDSDAEILNCRDMFTYGYSYSTFYRIPPPRPGNKELVLKFYVKAKSDAHVLLSMSDNLQTLDAFQPVYEIVLGAGKNTFSDIRRTRRSGSKTTVNTPDLLSPQELRGFWVRITANGVVEVGKDGEDIPFMFWQDTDPLPVKYFSFSTWSEVFGRWRFDCNSTGKDLSPTAQKPTTWVERLRSDLLKGYDTQVIPKTSFNERLEIKVFFQCNHILLDSKKSEMAVNGIFIVDWTDEKLNWNSSKYGGVRSLQLGFQEIWRPEFVLYNSVNHGAEPLGLAGLIVNSSGAVSWSSNSNLQARCNLDLSVWPWDQHTCKLVLGFWALKDFLKLTPQNRSVTKISNQESTSEWRILSIESEATWMETPWYKENESDGSDSDPNLSVLPADSVWLITFTVKRASGVYSYALFLPLIVNIAICLISFGLPPASTAKIGLLCTCLVLDSMFIIALDSMLPSTAEHTPYILKAYSDSMMIVTIATAVSVCVITLLRRPHFNPPHPFIRRGLDWAPLKLVLLLPVDNLNGLTNYGQLDKPEGPTDTDTHQHYWTLFGCVIDRIALLMIIACAIRSLIFNS